MANRDRYTVTIDLDITSMKDLKRVEAELENIIKLSKRVEKNAGKGFDKLNKTTKKTQIQMRGMGRSLQNVSYQLQDIVTQVSGGVDPFISLGQQLPQMLINMGALGAVVGVVAATLPLMIKALSETTDEAKTLDEAIEKLTEAGDQYTDSLKRYAADQSDFNAAVLRSSEILVGSELLKFIEMASSELQPTALDILIDRLETIKTLVDGVSGPLATMGKLLGQIARTTPIVGAVASGAEYYRELQQEAERLGSSLDKIQAKFGVDPATARQLKVIIDGFDGASDSVEGYVRQLKALYAVAPEGNKAGLLEYIRQFDDTFDKVLQNVEVKAKKIKAATEKIKGPTLNRVVAQDPYDTTFKQAEANLKLAESYRMLYDPLAAYEAELEKIISVQNLMSPETTAKAVEAAADAYEKATEQITFAQQAAEVFQQSFDTAFQGVAMGTQDVSDAFRNMAKVIIAQLLKIAAYKTIAGFGFGGEFGGQVAWGAAQGGVVSGGNKLQAFASGGIVNGPTAFGMSRGRTGLMGEAGPEMIAPVKRMPNGDMGVGASPVNVTVNNNAAGVETIARQDSNGGLTIDVVLKQAAQAIQSGGNVFADSLEKSYSLNRGRSTY